MVHYHRPRLGPWSLKSEVSSQHRLLPLSSGQDRRLSSAHLPMQALHLPRVYAPWMGDVSSFELELPSDNKGMELQRQDPTAAAEPEVTLREFTLSDADAEAFMSWASDPLVARFQRRDAFTDLDQARRYLAAHVLPHPWYRAICLAGRPVGSISVKPAAPAAEDGGGRLFFKASVGYRVARAHWGRGVATRAVRAAAAAVFRAWPWLLRLEAVADVENPASQRVLEKAGFAREGVLRKYILLKGTPRDMVMFSIVADTDGEHKPAQNDGP
ncbi:hypothetical protein ACP4OV_007716 [Aristida adscensionis]